MFNEGAAICTSSTNTCFYINDKKQTWREISPISSSWHKSKTAGIGPGIALELAESGFFSSFCALCPLFPGRFCLLCLFHPVFVSFLSIFTCPFRVFLVTGHKRHGYFPFLETQQQQQCISWNLPLENTLVSVILTFDFSVTYKGQNNILDVYWNLIELTQQDYKIYR